MKFKVEAYRRSRDGDEQVKVTEATFTFVAIDSGNRPRPLPPA
jgi:acyl-CoA thioesterase YciA